MTDQELIKRASKLREMTLTDGFQILRQEIESRIREGWEKFIDLPAEKKTSKTAFEHQANYRVLKDILEWIEDEIRDGGKAEKRFTSQLERAGVRNG